MDHDTIAAEGPATLDALDALVRLGAARMLQAAIEAEVDAFCQQYADRVDEQGRRHVVRNGFLPKRNILTGAGQLPVRQPRVRDNGPAESRVTFHSQILPAYLRRSKSIDELIPWLYLKGVSTGDFAEALQSLIGPEAANLSATTVTRLKESWQGEYEAWCRRDLSQKEYVYIWADGVHFNIRLEEDRQCILVLIGATADGKKELLAISDGYRESEASWSTVLLDLKAHGLSKLPKLIIADGALGLWAAVNKQYGTVCQQRCTVHKTANVLDKLPKSVQPQAKAALNEIWQAPTREQAEKAFDLFISKYQAKYCKATDCLAKDRHTLLTYYDFPAEHWAHLRSTNVIESVFATVRLRHRKTKGNGTRSACLTMVFKLMESAQRRWRRLNSFPLLQDLLRGKTFVNGVMQDAA